ncbi:MAG TPA: lytic transglycosylase domain-containing protein, partial [Sphingomicrobium sp.]|nr:lytic transglycosylase domain-containing protein [Sphingomicrobium sp.]
MSSMRTMGIILPLLLSSVAVASVQQANRPAAPVRAVSNAPAYDINYALADWRRLRASDGYAFADYARFLNANPGWPGESGLRRSAEKQMRPGENADTVLSFFRTEEPKTGNGWARLADAKLAIGKPAEALAAARGAWMSGDLSQYDEQLLFSRFGSQLTAAD